MSYPAKLRAFLEWKRAARPGDRFEYHRGFMPLDTNEHSPRYLAATTQVRQAVIAAYLTGDYEIAQRRVGDAAFSYIIVRRAQRDGAPRLWTRQSDAELIRGGTHRSERRRAA